MRTKELCPLCEEGTLTDMVGKVEICDLGVVGEVDIYYSTCNHCLSEMSDHTQMQSNKTAAMKFYEEASGLIKLNTRRGNDYNSNRL